MRRSSFLIAIALPLVLVACGGSSATPTPLAPTVAPSAVRSAVPASVAPSLAAGPTVVAVAIADYAFTPSAITVPAGEVTFQLNNTAAQEHEFEIFKGDAVVDEAEGLVPGLERDLIVTLEPGDYTFACKLADHEARGMKGTLTVTAA